MAHVLKGKSVDSASEGFEEEESAKTTKRPWGFPKAHGMAAHVSATTLLYEDRELANVSAQIIANMRVPVKELTKRSNGKRGWEAQAINMRKRELALKTWIPLTATLDSDVVSNPAIVETRSSDPIHHVHTHTQT